MLLHSAASDTLANETETPNGSSVTQERPHIRDLLKLPQTWGAIIARTFTDPVFFFIADWFPIYLVAKGITLQSGLIAIWIPFVAADLGNLSAGAASGYLIRRGWSVGRARKRSSSSAALAAHC